MNVNGRICPYCLCVMRKHRQGRKNSDRYPTNDHVVPKAIGGASTILVCLRCNNEKGDMLPDEWHAWLTRHRPHAAMSAERAMRAAMTPSDQRAMTWAQFNQCGGQP